MKTALHWVQKNAAVSLEVDLDQQNGDSDGDVVMRSGSGKESDNEGSESELSTFMLELENAPEDK